MTLTTLLLVPDQGYQVDPGLEAFQGKALFGRPRVRSGLQNELYSVQVQWTCSAARWEYLRAFYRTTTKYGSLPFQISLYIEDATQAVYKAYFVPGTFKLTKVRGTTHTAVATLDVMLS